MQKISKPANDPANPAASEFVRRRRRKGAFGGILAFALLSHAVQVFGATAPPGPSVRLTWNPSPGTNVLGYNIYYGGASGHYTNQIKAGNVTNTTIAGLSAGTIYYFAAKAYDSLAEQSIFSNEASYTAPTTLTNLVNLAPGQIRTNGSLKLIAETGLSPAPLASLQIYAAPAGRFRLNVTGPSGQTNEIQATQDLAVWTSIGKVTLGAAGSLNFTDTNAAQFPQRFYRLFAAP